MSSHETDSSTILAAKQPTKARHRYVVFGISAHEPNPHLLEDLGNQGQGDPGKQGLGMDSGGDPGKAGLGSSAGLFKNGIAMIQGVEPANWFGAIEFPCMASAMAWIYSAAGTKFCERYETVFVAATHA